MDRVQIVDFLTFSSFGSGANWVLPTVLFQQIPYFQEHLPEGLCISTYMNAAVNCGLITFFTFLAISTFVFPIENHRVVPFMLATSVLGTFLSAFVFGITIQGVSIMLYFSCFVGGSVGCLSSVVMNPFMTQYKNEYITAARAGGSGMILICALVSLVQSPGKHPPRFSPTVFILLFAGILAIAPYSFYRIRRNEIGMRNSEDNDGDESIRQTGSILQENVPSSSSPKDIALSNMSTRNADSDHTMDQLESKLMESFHDMADVILVRRDRLTPRERWLRFAAPHMIAVGWVSFNTWGMLSAFIPFAIKNSLPKGDSGNGSTSLALAIQLAGFCLVAGDLSTQYVKLSIPLCLIAFTAFAFTIYVAAMNSYAFESDAAGPIIVILFALGRFFEAHVVTSTYRTIASKVPAEFRSDIARCVGIAEQLMTTLGTICSTAIISSTSNC
jgi:hypothetical protein